MNFRVLGKVIKGKGKGKKLGFPTVNVELDGKIESSVYAGIVRAGREEYKAGIFVGNDARILEAHLVGFSGNLYGKIIEIEIEKKIRDVIKFKNDGELKEQIRRDIELMKSQSANRKAQNHS